MMKEEREYMFTFSKDYYTEVKTVKSTITYVEVHGDNRILSDTVLSTSARIRLYDGVQWREKSITDVRNVQETIDRMIDEWEKEKSSYNNRKEMLNPSAAPKRRLQEKKQKAFRSIPGRSGRYYHFADTNITHIPMFMKQNMCKDFYSVYEKANAYKAKNTYFTRYEDIYSSISILDSNGHDELYDEQRVSVSLCNEENVEEKCKVVGNYFDEIAGQKTEWQSEITGILDKES